ncbi:MAG TPA: hypothetical protein DD377_01295 [Firmicutes bacterium]|nr:hypothetical protein [Bacillota bacterium]
MHKYLFLWVDSGHEVEEERVFDTRNDGIRYLEKILEKSDNQVEDIIFKDKRHHEQEFVCGQGVRFLIYRI